MAISFDQLPARRKEGGDVEIFTGPYGNGHVMLRFLSAEAWNCMSINHDVEGKPVVAHILSWTERFVSAQETK